MRTLPRTRRLLAAAAISIFAFGTAACTASVESTDDGVQGEIDTEEDTGTETES